MRFNLNVPNSSLINSANSNPIRSCASTVAAPMCGVVAILEWLRSALFGFGSSSNTSSAIPPTCPLSNANIKSCQCSSRRIIKSCQCR